MITLFPQLIAQTINNRALGPLGNLSPTEFFSGLIPALLSLGFVIGVIVFIFIFIIGAIGLIASGGDKMKMEQARSRIVTALIGITILLSFFAILSLTEHFFGIGLRQIEVGPFRIELTGNSESVDDPGTCVCVGMSVDSSSCGSLYHPRCFMPDECECVIN